MRGIYSHSNANISTPKIWKNNVIRAKDPSSAWSKMVKNWFGVFAEFAQKEANKHHKRCETVNDVTPEIASAWFNHIKTTYTWETVLKMKHLISGTFTRLQANGLARINPLKKIQLRGGGNGENKKASRKALNAEETERMFEYARDTKIYPLVVAAACTGMRIGDVCNLKWSDVDLSGGLIDCVTAKAGVRVTIPIFGRLRDVLNDYAPVPGDGSAPSPYVFPEAQAHYARNKHYIIQAVKPLFARAVFGNTEPETEISETGEVQRELSEVIANSGFTERKQSRLMDVYARFKAGQRPIDIAAQLNVARSQISMDLRDIEKLTGQTLRPMAKISKQRADRIDLIEQNRQKRGIGKVAASIYGWHSFRHTFVVFALKAGVPVEDVRRIVGHGEAETTLENYYNPEKKHAAERMRRHMSGTVLDGDGTSHNRQIPVSIPTVTAPAPTIDNLISNLTDEQRKELARKLLGL